MSIKQSVIDIVAKQYSLDAVDVKENDSFSDLGDSLEATELIMELEEQFCLGIPQEESEKLKTVGDVISYIESRQRANV
ncbi:MAG: acyl carrier protein [Chlamydiales bacterium]|nr:acyl carrier protein [Chlamydiales bacterium]